MMDGKINIAQISYDILKVRKLILQKSKVVNVNEFTTKIKQNTTTIQVSKRNLKRKLWIF